MNNSNETPNNTNPLPKTESIPASTSAPVIEPTQPTNNGTDTNSNFPPSKKSKKLIVVIIAILFIIGAVIATIAIIVIITNSKKDNKSSISESLTQSDSFFIQDSNNNYALFDYSGNQLTDFIFAHHGSFVNGATEVENTEGQNGIVGMDGKMIIDFGKCKYLSQEGALYSCTDEEINDSLISAKGKTILQADELSVSSIIGVDPITIVKQTDEDEETGTYTIYDYEGKTIVSFPESSDEDKDEDDSFLSNDNGDYVSIYYGGTTYVIDLTKSKVVISLKDEKYPFCLDYSNEYNKSEFILSTCTSSLSKPETLKHKLVRDGKIVFTKETGPSGRVTLENGTPILNDNYNYILDDNGNTINDGGPYIDNKHYVIKNKDDDGLNIYNNGEKKHFDCQNTNGERFFKQRVYLFFYCKGYDKGEKLFVKEDGTIINKASYEYAEPFDDLGYAAVSEDGKKWHLINVEGETVSSDYSKEPQALYILGAPKQNGEPIYSVKNEDGSTQIFKINSDLSITGDETFNHARKIKDKTYVFVKKDDSYTLYNLSDEKEVITINSAPSTYDEGYFTTANDGKTQYHSYITGKMFFEK